MRSLTATCMRFKAAVRLEAIGKTREGFGQKARTRPPGMQAG
jgi:hypothetical protein